MDLSLPVVVAVVLLTVAVVGLLFYKNYKDKQELENKLNQDYRKPTHHHSQQSDLDEHT
jgi:hypothetical protein